MLLTNEDIDHTLGLLLLRQQETPLIVYATKQTQTATNWIDNVLQRFCGIEWRLPGADFEPLGGQLAFRSVELKHNVAFQFRDEKSGQTVLVAPAVSELTDELRKAANESDLLFFDGTFWSENELRAVRPGARTASQMRHLPIQDGSLDFLRDSATPRKIYIHINNTNPILMPGSNEHALLQAAGIEIAADGMEISL